MRRLVNELTKLPSIGEKTAFRLAYHLVTRKENDALMLAEALREAREKIRLCELCYSLTETTRCSICADPTRQHNVLCVVEKPADVFVLERSRSYKGLYHVLHGVWSPLRGIGPEDTKLGELLTRVQAGNGSSPQIEELVLATSTTVEGDATALYIAHSVAHLGLKVSRIAQGLPKGGELEYADDITLTHAMEGRYKLNQS